MTIKSKLTGVLVLLLLCSAASNANVFNGTLYYTTYSGGLNVHSFNYSYDQTTQALTLGSVTDIAALPGAAGIKRAEPELVSPRL